MNWKFLLLSSLLASVAGFGIKASAQDRSKVINPIKGRVEIEGQSRLVRPQQAQSGQASSAKQMGSVSKMGTGLHGALSRDVFSLGSQIQKTSPSGASKFMDPDFIKTDIKKSNLFDSQPQLAGRPAESAADKPSTEAKVEARKAPVSQESDPESNDYNPQKSRYKGKKILIRLKRYRSLSEEEVVWEAARSALRWLKKGADVTIFLEMEAANAANKNNTTGANFEQNRQVGNTSAEKLTTPQELLTQFVQAGGKLVVSERWTRLNFVSQGALITGTQLLREEDMDDVLLDASYTNVISY